MHNKLTKLLSFKKIILLLVMAELFNFSAMANPGDTTVVTVYNLRKITQYGNYDTTAVFPTGKRYRKIRMHYILGRYACPAGSQYCGSWDYTTQIYARPAGKDSVEIARIITPYATDWLTLNKKHDYIVEVTDYASALDGLTAMRFGYQGYSWGFTITLKIEFIEGIPPMDALSVKNIYDGYFAFGNTADPIENHLSAKSYSYTSSSSRNYIKNTVSGHGSDNAGCSEFCSKYYQLKINNNMVSQKQLWRDNCGANEVYPQTGTWIYERGNWCPGAIVWPIYHNLTPITTANSTFTVDIDMQPYVGAGSYGGYNFVSQLINYSAPNNTRDVSIEDIISPTIDDNYLRENPRCSNPVIKIKNTGTDSLKSVVFGYGLKGGTVFNYTWTGSIGFLDTAYVVFPPATAILSGTTSSVFEVKALTVNGSTGDQNAFNNIYSSKTSTVPVYPSNFVVKMYTNNNVDATGFSQTSWFLTDQTGAVVYQRDQLASATVYIDTLTSLPGGCYKMEIIDTGCDGMSWWANTAGGTGTLRFDYIGANSTIAYFPGDIGCGYVRYFRILDPPPPPVDTTGLAGLVINPNRIDVYPNPANNTAYIKFDMSQSQNVNYKIMDITGKTVQQKTMHKAAASYEMVDISQLNNGVYFISIELQDKSVITKKLVVQK